jgi:leucyl aminopeptidase (aminopeptidase T)
LTEFSATAPCKLLAKKFGFRGTTMPGFATGMISSLRIDYAAVHRRISVFKKLLDRAERETIRFLARGETHVLAVDLRRRTATASSGLSHDDFVVGNLPSGEAYIVPYEGEAEGEPSATAGTMPVQFGDEIVVYRIEANRAVEVLSTGAASDRERNMLADEPAYGNIAEIGHGILGEFGCIAAGNLLMDEKLGLHIAFGRSDHFGGVTSPALFHDPKKVVHIDRVYVPSLQPDVRIEDVTLFYPDGTSECIMKNDAWTVL